MATVEITTDATVKPEFSSLETIKSMMNTLTEQSTVIKNLMVGFRLLMKDAEKNGKELDKLRNKKTRKTERNPNALPSGITKPVVISDELAKFLGVAPGTLVPRNEVTKGVSGFVKSNELSDPANKQKFVLDDRPAAKALRVLLGNPKEDVTYFNLQRYLKHHYLPMPADKPVAEVKKTKEIPTPAPVVEAAAPAKVLKKVLVKKKPATELTEEA